MMCSNFLSVCLKLNSISYLLYQSIVNILYMCTSIHWNIIKDKFQKINLKSETKV